MSVTIDTIMPRKDPEARRAYDRENARRWRAANRERHRAYMRAWYAENDRPAYLREWRAGNPRAAYAAHKTKAKHRGVPFLLTFEEWWNIWQASGKWEQRGCRKGQYVMARLADSGAYSCDNVRICTTGENRREAWDLQEDKTLKRTRGAKYVFRHSDETRKRMSAAAKARWARHRGLP